MQLNSEVVTPPPRASVTVVLLRDEPEKGLEVFYCVATRHRPSWEDGIRTMSYPSDIRHSNSQRAMPGPTRLRFVAGRFEPVGGFKEFL
jgi:hypothetical protein